MGIGRIDYGVNILRGTFTCLCCNKEYPLYYVNKGNNTMKGYWGDRGRYNFRGAKANFLRHARKCLKQSQETPTLPEDSI